MSNLKPDDTGWIDISPEIGTWKLLKYRRVGDLVNVKGHCNSLTFAGGSAIKLATLPEDIRPTMTNEYLIAPAGGKKLIRVGLNTKGNIFLDCIINISDASNYTGDTWIFFNFVYFIL